MNRSITANRFHPSLAILIGLLCFCVTMQLLGVSFSLWDLEEAADLVELSLEEGFSLPAHTVDFSPSLLASLSLDPAPLEHGVLLERSLFHPPDSHA